METGSAIDSSALLEKCLELLAQRDLDEMLKGALSFLVRSLGAKGGSLFLHGERPRQIRQGELPPKALEQIGLWEKGLGKRLAAGPLAAPPTVPITIRPLSGDGLMLLNAPLLSQAEVVGSVSLVLEPGRKLTPEQRRFLGHSARMVGSVARLLGELTLTRQRLNLQGLFFQVGQTMVSTFDLTELLQQIMELATSVLDARAATLMLLDNRTGQLVSEIAHGEGREILRRRRVPYGKGIAGWVAAHGEPLLINNVPEDPRFDQEVDARTGFLTYSAICVPLQIKGRTIGVLEVLNKRSDEGFDEEDLRLLLTIASQAAVAIENIRLYQSLREERDKILKAQEDVRRELARKLHDGTVQLLAAIAMGIDHVERLLKLNPDAVSTELEALRKLTRQATREARLALFELRPLVLESQGLVPALEAYVQQLRQSEEFNIFFEAGELTHAIDSRVGGIIFSIVQEAINNVKRHAKARNLWLRLWEEDEHLVVTVEDDGRGFDIEAVEQEYEKRGSFGLLNMRERAELIDATLSIVSNQKGPKTGTTVTLRVPLKPS